MRNWWRRNRLALLLLPVALVVAFAAASSRLGTYWWQTDFRSAAQEDGEVVRLVDSYDDGVLTYPIEAEYELVEVAPATAEDLDGDVLPDELRAWRVVLEVSADPDVALKGCSIALMADDGRRFEADDAVSLARGDWARPQCVPEETPGPVAAPFRNEQPVRDPATGPRPERFRTTSVVVTTSDVRPTSVRIWYFLPRYAELDV